MDSDKQSAADKVVQAAQVLSNARNNANRLGLEVDIITYGDEISARIYESQETVYAETTPKKGKR